MSQPISSKQIEQRIYLLRGHKILLDSDLAELYGIKTFNLNKAVKRNRDRFPNDFMFQLTGEETKNLKFHLGISSWGGRRYRPYAFTEQGVAMLSSVLNSKRAVQVNIAIVRIFVKLRSLLAGNRALEHRLDALEKKYDAQFGAVFDAIRKLIAETPPSPPRRRIGFLAD
ncbi:MAG: DNA-binding protein [Candidatus Omnitrophica bacterium CG11_big_fil_rev_8_21_14_0_20_64_10]|nr:MAG: DNA-binding protein [Candidatus Omnitrophica bacterium CG11_big_fil_rev_8_21_14_0_20_64_10]